MRAVFQQFLERVVIFIVVAVMGQDFMSQHRESLICEQLVEATNRRGRSVPGLCDIDGRCRQDGDGTAGSDDFVVGVC